MSDPNQSPVPPAAEAETAHAKDGQSPLREAIRRVRVVHTDQADGLADLRDAERARLELLADDLADLVAEVPDDLEFFAFALSNGETPRLWIDMTCHVGMGRDRRTYRLLKDTRVGRSVLAETSDRAEMAARIADYVAERMIDRQRAIEGDWLSLKRRPAETSAAVREPNAPPQPANEDEPTASAPANPRAAPAEVARASRGAKWVALFLGILVGAGGLAATLIYLGRL